MDVESQDVNENVEPTTEASGQMVESLADLEALQDGSPVAEPAPEQATAESDAYAADLTYKVKDEVREFDSRFKDVVRDKETEEYIRDLYTRADGLDGYKEKLSARETEYQTLYDHAKGLTDGYARLKEMRDKRDYAGLQKALGLDDEYITEWGVNRLDYQELPEETRQLMEKNKELEEKLNGYEQKLTGFEETNNNARLEQEFSYLNSLNTDERYSGVAQAMQEKGLSFTQAIMDRGIAQFKMTGQEPSIDDVAQVIANQYSWMVAQPEPEINNEPAPTIPSLTGHTNQAMVDSPIATMADLIRLADQVE